MTTILENIVDIGLFPRGSTLHADLQLMEDDETTPITNSTGYTVEAKASRAPGGPEIKDLEPTLTNGLVTINKVLDWNPGPWWLDVKIGLPSGEICYSEKMLLTITEPNTKP